MILSSQVRRGITTATMDKKTPLEKKLIKNLGKKNCQLRDLNLCSSFQTKMVVELCIELGKFDKLLDMIATIGFLYKGNSSVFGISTVISNYTNKAGESHECHYTAFGKYFGSVKNLGPKPIHYEGNFRMNYDRLKLFKMKENYTAEDIEHFAISSEINYLFELRPQVVKRKTVIEDE